MSNSNKNRRQKFAQITGFNPANFDRLKLDPKTNRILLDIELDGYDELMDFVSANIRAMWIIGEAVNHDTAPDDAFAGNVIAGLAKLTYKLLPVSEVQELDKIFKYQTDFNRLNAVLE